jgi:MazG family protein
MARLRAPDGCPWDREQTHKTIAYHAIEEVYELIDAIEAGDDHEMMEELGDLLLQVVFHCQLAQERGSFDFDDVTRNLVQKLIRRHPHVFGDLKVKSVTAVWAQWDRIKKAEKRGTKQERTSALDGIPKHLPALMRAEKLVRKARKAGLIVSAPAPSKKTTLTPSAWSAQVFALVEYAQQRGWVAEALLRTEARKKERVWRRMEQARQQKPSN